MEPMEFNDEILDQYEPEEFKRGDTVKGTVVGKEEDGIVVDFGGKSEGFVPENELLKPITEYKIGDVLVLQILKLNYEERSILSERRPVFKNTLEELKKAYEEKSIVKARVVSQVKGGYTVLLKGVVPAFLPGSHSLLKRDEPLPQKEVDVIILDMVQTRRGVKIIVSRKAVRDKKIEQFFSEKKVGDTLECEVRRIHQSGVEVEVPGGIRGFIPRSELSYDAKALPEDILQTGQSIMAKIIRMDKDKKNVILSLKQLMPDPWNKIEEKYPIGKIVTGEVVSIHPFGFFVRLEPGVEGLVPRSEVFWGNTRKSLEDVVKVGDLVKVEVIDLDKENRKLTLSYRKAKGDPWENIEDKYYIGNVTTGKVVGVVRKGIFVELEEGIEGFVPILEISWERIDNPEEIVKIGEKVKVKIMNIDKENRRISLSMKRTQENPWERALRELERDSIVKGVVKKVVNSGAVVRVEGYDVEGFVPNSHLVSEPKEGETLNLVVLRIDPDEIFGGRMLLSEKRYEERMNIEEYKKKVEKEKAQKSLGELLEKNGE
ncbi:30S ribosomal protein S1 [Thermotoga sp. KOL6]|uniref:30S ribosomal protein S1 n=1 Tax=Thermotoga sp. KOL6 TaxID=126741 RepID=UPI000C768EA8|nr:30S ribosomal protein S1 [Thermotoga sp. KOL6]PLV60175.1 30S ribosomal protein S1 [Thermotoga sp. KOL6]